MHIETISLDFSRETDQVRRKFRPRSGVPMVGDFPPLLKLLRSSSPGPVIFRLTDAPQIIVEWHRFGKTSAVAYLVEDGVPHLATLQLTGLEQRNDDTALAHLVAIIPAFGSWLLDHPITPLRPLLVMATLSEIEADNFAPIIPLICLMPALCELAGMA